MNSDGGGLTDDRHEHATYGAKEDNLHCDDLRVRHRAVLGLPFLRVQIWVARLRISRQVAEKINNLHHIEPQEIRDAVECVAGLHFSEDLDPERGRRVIVKTRIRNEDALVVLYSADDLSGDVWRLGSAYFVTNR